LILSGVFNISTNPTAKKGGVIVLIVGVLLQLRNLEIFEIFDYISFWPLAIILFGVWFMLSSNDEKEKLTKDSFDTINLFSGSENRFATDDFKGGSSIVAFGGVEVDLRESEIKGEEAQIDLFVAFGGADISVPKDWNVVIKGVPIFGGWDDNTSINDKTEAPTLVVHCVLLFAGFDIKD
jgi:predicted membrane protein